MAKDARRLLRKNKHKLQLYCWVRIKKRGAYPKEESNIRKMAIPVVRNLNGDISVGYRLVIGVMEKA